MKLYYYLLYRCERLFRVSFEELGWWRRGYQRTQGAAYGLALLLLPALAAAPYGVPAYRHWLTGRPDAALLAGAGLAGTGYLLLAWLNYRTLASARYRACAAEFAQHSALRSGLGLLGCGLLAAACWWGPLRLLAAGH